MSTYQLTLPPHTVETAHASASALLEKAQKQLGFVPNMYARMAQLPGLLESYSAGYEAFRSQGGFAPPEQEVVLITISRDNQCRYCVAAHSMIGKHVTKVPEDVLTALRAGAAIADPRLAALSTFTSQMLASRGNPTAEQVATFLRAGFEERHVLAIVLAISVKTISNYANHVFHTPIDTAFASFEWNPS
ncbi:MAG: carboxymuconolactone decarboxylase family protein [Kofleriaceae bacterium]